MATYRRFFLTPALGMFLAMATWLGDTPAATAQSGLDKEEIGKIVREYLLENPELLLEIQTALQTKQEAELLETQKRYITANQDRLQNGKLQINFGSPEAEVTVVEFFDYNCGYCKRAIADMQKLMAEDANIRFVLKEFPVLGADSIEAAQASMAFGKLKPALHGRFHIELLEMEGIKNAERAMELAEQLGVSREEMTETMKNPEINDAIREAYELADGLGISGTPSYVAGERVIFGAVGYNQLREALDSQVN